MENAVCKRYVITLLTYRITVSILRQLRQKNNAFSVDSRYPNTLRRSTSMLNQPNTGNYFSRCTAYSILIRVDDNGKIIFDIFSFG